MKWLFIFLLVAVLIGGAIYSGMTAATVVELSPAMTQDIREFVDEQAVTRVPLTHLITMPLDGRIEPITLAEGTKVTRGQKVAEVSKADLDLAVQEAEANVERLQASIIESSDKTVESTTLEQSNAYVLSMKSTVDAAQARVDSGEARYNFAKNDHGRIRTLRETGAASIEQLQAAELRMVEAEADLRQDQLIQKSLQSLLVATVLLPRVVNEYMNRKDKSTAVIASEKKQAEVKLQERERDAARGIMTSPVDGVVLERLETNERRVSPGTVLLKIGRPEELEVEADVLSQDVVRVKPGDAVEIYGPAIGLTPAKGTVTKIYPAGFTKVSSLGVEQQRVKVIVAFDEQELQKLRNEKDLGIGYRVRVRIFTAERQAVVTVPRSALFRGPENQWQLFVVRDGRAVLENVTVGLMNDERAEIVAGVKEGEPVVPAPESTLVAGTRVRAAKE